MVLRQHGYGVWIELDGEPLEEYAVEVKGHVISCYICSEEGRVRTAPLSSLLFDPNSPLTRYVHKKFVLHFDDDGSYSSGQATPFGSYGRSVTIRADGQHVESVWGGVMQKLTSDGMRDGDIVRPYIFAPIDTTGPSTASSP
jgi:hypothetical protein